jgi:hypothetical protein
MFLSVTLLFSVSVSLYSQQKNDIDDDEDLFDQSTDYKETYNDLSNDGEWIQMTKGDLMEQSTDDGTGSGYNSKDESEMQGIVMVWRPWGYHTGWTPYSNGRWIYTDCNWYWSSYYSWGWAPYHYGRWVYNPIYGWVWIPGRHWAPAWVDWCWSDSYVGWYPRYPRFHRTFDYHRYYEREHNRWVFVERNKMLDPKINKHNIVSSELNKDIISKSKINSETNKYLNGKIVSAGPNVKELEKTMGKKIDEKKINYTDAKDKSKVADKNVYAYKPNTEVNSKSGKENLNKTKTKSDNTNTKSVKDKNVKTKNDNTSVKTNNTYTKTDNTSLKKDKNITNNTKKQPKVNVSTNENKNSYNKTINTGTRNTKINKSNTGNRNTSVKSGNINRRNSSNITKRQYSGNRSNTGSRGNNSTRSNNGSKGSSTTGKNRSK